MDDEVEMLQFDWTAIPVAAEQSLQPDYATERDSQITPDKALLSEAEVARFLYIHIYVVSDRFITGQRNGRVEATLPGILALTIDRKPEIIYKTTHTS